MGNCVCRKLRFLREIGRDSVRCDAEHFSEGDRSSVRKNCDRCVISEDAIESQPGTVSHEILHTSYKLIKFRRIENSARYIRIEINQKLRVKALLK